MERKIINYMILSYGGLILITLERGHKLTITHKEAQDETIQCNKCDKGLDK